jgi:putative ABC transport system permease protein
MISLALRSMAQRKLRAALTAVAILLGVAMIAGTYVQTDQINSAFEDIEQTANEGVDAVVTRREAFSGDFAGPQPLDSDSFRAVHRVEGIDRLAGELWESGALVVDGQAIQSDFAPSAVISDVPEPFNAFRPVRGRLPAAAGEVAVNTKLADDEHLQLGQRVGVTTRTGVQPVRVVGVVDYGDVASIGGATLIVARLQDEQLWFDRQGEVTRLLVSAAPGVAPEELATRLRAVLDDDLVVKTGTQAAADDAKEINEQIGGFLTPALLTFAGAALLVGAFIIFNTFSITVAQRTREFALLRALGSTRRQVLAAVAAEALVVGVLASVAGLVVGLGFARGLGALFDAAGMGIPRGDMELAPRTIIVALSVGIGVTLVAALIPAVRATRVSPVAAMRDDVQGAGPRHPVLRRLATGAIAIAGLALVLQGLLGGGTATARLGSMGAGTLLVFIGVAASARYVVRPLAALAGWPLERLRATTGELARENASRNPGRTAVTAAALMVGLGLVVFVAVFAAGLKDTIDGGIADRLKGELIVSSDTAGPLPGGAAARINAVPQVEASSPQYVDRIQVDGGQAKAATDILNGVEPAAFPQVYDFRWLDGEVDLSRLGPADAVIEEQFGEEHGIGVGDTFSVRTPTGRTASFRALGRYRDPAILQGVIVDAHRFLAVSAARDPFSVMIALRDGDEAEVTRAKADVARALEAFPTAKVRTGAEYRDWVVGRLDQIVFLLYALLAMSLVISLFGIANSLFLSIHERTREIGMLRAVGATAGQVRQIIRYESVITAVIGGLLGTAIGVLFAWLSTFALEDLGVGFSLPVGQLAVLLAVAVVVGVVGAVVPARRASRLNVLDAIARGE